MVNTDHYLACSLGKYQREEEMEQKKLELRAPFYVEVRVPIGPDDAGDWDLHEEFETWEMAFRCAYDLPEARITVEGKGGRLEEVWKS